MNTNGNGNGHGKNPAVRSKAGQFVKGASGNPGGRQKTRAVAIREAILKHAAGRIGKGEGKGRNRLLALIDRLYYEDPKTYLAYAFGKPIETHEVTGPEGGSIPHEFTIIGITSEELTAAFPTRSE